MPQFRKLAFINKSYSNKCNIKRYSTIKSSKSMYVTYAPEFFCPLPASYSFPMRKYPLLYDILKNENILTDLTTISPLEATWEDLSLVHTTEHLNKFKNGTLTDKDVRILGMPWSEPMLKRWRMTCQGTVEAGLMALFHKVAGNISGGYHHSFPDYGHGYCPFNDTALAIRKLQKELWISTALVVDLDTHQGDGTAKIFENDKSVVTFSMHGEKNFPYSKMRSTIDVNLPDRCGDDMYLQLLQENLNKSISYCKSKFNDMPSIVFYLAGVDIAEGDKLGRLGVSRDGIKKRENIVLEYFLKKYNIPIVLLTAGGYNSTIELTADMHADVFREAVKILNNN